MTMPNRPKRKHIPVSVQRDSCLYALGMHPDQCEFDHDPALELRPTSEDGTDFDPPQLDPRYITPRLKEDHKRKTFGDPAIPLSGDLAKIAKTKRLEISQKAFRDLILKPDRTFTTTAKRKHHWPKRKIRS